MPLPLVVTLTPPAEVSAPLIRPQETAKLTLTSTPVNGTPPSIATTCTGVLPPEARLAGPTVMDESDKLEAWTAKSNEPVTATPTVAFARSVAAPMLEMDAGAIATSATPVAVLVKAVVGFTTAMLEPLARTSPRFHRRANPRRSAQSHGPCMCYPLKYL